jgi:adenylate cyclase, class 2
MMVHMIEVERKYRINPEQTKAIAEYLKTIEPGSKSIHQVDVVYLPGIDSFKSFQPGMAVVRIRTEDKISKLTYKKSLNQLGDSIEHEVLIGDAKIMHEILKADDYRIVTEVTKDRIEVHTEDVTYALDNVEQLGWFLEIEVVIPNELNLLSAEKAIKIAATNLSLTDEMIEQKKYDQLIAALPK